MTERRPLELLIQLENILDSDPLIDELGFIHPSQFVTLNEKADDSAISPAGTVLQLEDGVVKSRISEDLSNMFFWCRDHKLGISTQVLLPLYGASRHAFMAALERFKVQNNFCMNRDESPENMTSCMSSPLNILEAEVMKHSRVLLLLSSDVGTAWNARKLVLSSKQQFQMFVDELFFSELVLSYAPKSDMAWSHRRWLIKITSGKFSNVQEIVEKESELVKRIAEKSKMNYRAWNHRCWLISYMSEGQVQHELHKSKEWAGLHVADSSCFHYRTRLLLKMLANSSISCSCNAELRQTWKEELEWNKMLLQRYAGREALWLYRRFLSLCWIKHFATETYDIACHSDGNVVARNGVGVFMDSEFQLVRSCLTILDDDYEDFRTHAMFSAAYALWLTKQISEAIGIDIQEKLPARELEEVLNNICPGKVFLHCALEQSRGSTTCIDEN